MLMVAWLLLYYGLFVARYTPNHLVLTLAAWGLSGAGAELLPRDHAMLAGFLRLASGASFVLVFVVIAVDIFTGN